MSDSDPRLLGEVGDIIDDDHFSDCPDELNEKTLVMENIKSAIS